MKQFILLLVLLALRLSALGQTTRLVTSAADAGTGSLRQALTGAASGDSIVFAPALANQTIRLNTQLTLNKSVVIDGRRAPNLTLSGENRVRILTIDYSFVTVVIRNLTFANGRAVDANASTVLRGGAIELTDPNTLRLENCRFLRNVGERSGAVFVGYGARATVLGCAFDDNDGTPAGDGFSAGAISTFGGGPGATVLPNGVGGNANLDVRNCTFRRNKGNVGGCIYVLLGGLQVENCLFRKSEADAGGAIFQDGCNGTERDDNLGGTTTIRNCVVDSSVVRGGIGGGFFLWGYSLDKYVIENTTVAHNLVLRGGQYNESKGGGIQVRDRASLVLRRCTLADNEVAQQGGGLWLDCRGPEGITVENCTFSGNRASTSARGGDIGGAAVFNTPPGVAIRIVNTTFVNNASDRADGCVWIAGGSNAQTLTFTNCAFAGNRAGSGNQNEQTVNFPALSGGGNFVQNAGGSPQTQLPATYAPSLGLGPLQTLTVAGQRYLVHQPLRTSVLVDAGVLVAGLATDQLGTARPQDGDGNGTARFDPGAVELPAAGPLAAAAAAIPAATLEPNFPNPFADRTTLRYALAQPGPVTLRVFDATGRIVAVLVNGVQGAGGHEVVFAAGRLPGGVYVGELATGGGTQRQRLVVAR